MNRQDKATQALRTIGEYALVVLAGALTGAIVGVVLFASSSAHAHQTYTPTECQEFGQWVTLIALARDGGASQTQTTTAAIHSLSHAHFAIDDADRKEALNAVAQVYKHTGLTAEDLGTNAIQSCIALKGPQRPAT